MHDTMAFNLEGTPLGLINVQCWARNREEYGKRHKRYKLPIEEKESRKWLISYAAAAEVQKKNPKTMIVSVGDREADIYELLEKAAQSPKGPKLLIRAGRERLITQERVSVWDYMEKKPISGTEWIKVPRKGNQPAREAELTIRFGEVEIRAPKRKKEKASLKIWVILAQEKNAEESVSALEWFLFSTIPVRIFEEAVEKLEWYTKRWGIEIYHKTLKSGCKIEQRQLGSAERIETCLAIDLVIAWRIYYLTKLGREIPDVPCTVFLKKQNGKPWWHTKQKFL